MIDCRRVPTPCCVDGAIPQVRGLGGERDSAETARRQELAADVESRLEVRPRDLRGPCNVRESPGVSLKNIYGSRRPASLREKTSTKSEPQDRQGEKKHDSKNTHYDLHTDVDEPSAEHAAFLRSHRAERTRPDGRDQCEIRHAEAHVRRAGDSASSSNSAALPGAARRFCGVKAARAS